MRIAFFGTPQFAADILSGILQFPDIETVLVVSQPDMPVGRKQELLPTPVKQVALENGIEVLQPESLKKTTSSLYPTFSQGEKGQAQSFSQILENLNLDFIVVVAYGKIIPKYILDIPKYGCINIHGSILPKYRGASPVQECLKNGDTQTWLTTMYMSERMDEGGILQIAKIDIDIVDKAPDIFQKFVHIGPELLQVTLQKIKSWQLQGTPQNHSQASYCSKIEKEDGKIDFHTQNASEIYNLFRAYTPWPGIYTLYEGKRLVLDDCMVDPLEFSLDDVEIWTFVHWWAGKNKKYGIICKDGTLLDVRQVKPEGKKSMDILSFVNGNKGVLEYIFE